MAHFLVDSHMGVDPAGGGDVVVGQILGKTKQNAHGQLIVQEAALQVAGGGALGPGIEADDIAHLQAQLTGGCGGIHILVQHDLHGVPAALGVAVGAVDMDGCIGKLAGALDDLAGAGVDADILSLGILGTHTAQGGHHGTAVALDAADHAAQRVGVGLQQQAVIFVSAAQIDEDAALGGDLGVEAQGAECLPDPGRSLGGVAGGGVDGQQSGGLLPCVVGVRTINHKFFLQKSDNTTRPRPPGGSN